MGKSTVVRWGRASNGGRHLLHTHPRYLDRPGVTPIAMCGVALEIVSTKGAAWDEHGPLACADCSGALVDWIAAPWIGHDE